MRHTVLGLFGYRPTAFYNSAFDEGLIRRTFGIRMEETDLKTVFDEMEKTDPKELEKDKQLVASTFRFAENLPQEYKDNHSKLYLALKKLVKQEGYDYCAIKCWPEMGNLKTTPCAVLGRLADANINIACEGDVDATLAMIVQNCITGQANFITDMIDLHEDGNYLTFWHCGNAAPSLHHKEYPTKMGDHPLAGQGTAFYTTLKEGPVTISRFCNIDGVYKLFMVRGMASKTDLYTPGSMVNVVPDAPVNKIMDATLKNGVPHHYSIVWEDVTDIMKMVAEILGIEVIQY
jgi:L-fucose isomerase-like protein